MTSEPALLILGASASAWALSYAFAHFKMKREFKKENERKAALSNGDEIYIVSPVTGHIVSALFVMRYQAYLGERVIGSFVGDDHANIDVWSSQVFTTRAAAVASLKHF
ncbi:hypothetical protein FRN31_22275 [Vibrio alginolyticus]|nr:hypothetical protein [Vibrio alginolyticus]